MPPKPFLPARHATAPASSGVRFAPVPVIQPAVRRGVTFAPVPARRQNPVQRYKVVPAASQNAHNYGLTYDLRVSDDGKMAVKDTANTTPNGVNTNQNLYLAQDVFTASQAALNAAGSGVTLAQTGNTIRGKPQGNFVKRTLHEISIQFSDTPNNESYTACNANAWNVMGTVRNAQPTNTSSHGYFQSNINGSRLVASQADDGGAIRAVRSKITGQATTKNAKQDWQGLSTGARNRAAKKYGINQYAKPKAAESIGIFTAGTDGKSGMGHYAGILARSGGDYVTLENYAGNPGTSFGNGANINPNWYIRMFGAKTGQSFYEFHKTHESADYGSKPIAVRFRAV